MCLQAGKMWYILEICNYVIPGTNCVREKTILVSGGLTPYFVKGIIRIIKSI